MAIADGRMQDGERHFVYLAVIVTGLAALEMPVILQLAYLLAALPAWWQAR